MQEATRKASRFAEHGVAADRFAREIVGFLIHTLARSRQLNTRPLDGNPLHTKAVLPACTSQLCSGIWKANPASSLLDWYGMILLHIPDHNEE